MFSYSPQWFIFAQTGESNSHPGDMFSSSHQQLIYSNTRVTHILDMYSAILISGADLLKHWKATHSLDMCSSTFLICSNTREQLTPWTHIQPFLSVVGRATHKLDVYLAILIRGCDLLKYSSDSQPGCV